MVERFDDINSAQSFQDEQYNPQQKPSTMEDFEILKKLGDGAYSSVYQIKRKADGIIYALKKVKLMNLSEKEKENAINEVRILASIKHPNVISYKEAFFEPNTSSLCIVMEYADNGDLFQKIVEHQNNKTFFNEKEVVRGLKALHDLNIMHRDLKSANVFLNKDFTAKLGDMNVSKVVNKKGLNYTQTGTPYYASPEVWRDEPYDIKSDIWSLGCVLYEMIVLKPPFTADDMSGLFKKVTKGYFSRIPKSFSHDLWQLVKHLLQVSPSHRPSCDQIVNFPPFAKKASKLFGVNALKQEQNQLLKTIKFPKNLMYLSHKLPKQNYLNVSQEYTEDSSNFQLINLKSRKQSVKNLSTNQSKKELILPSIQNVKQIYMQSLNCNTIQDQEQETNSKILAYSGSRKKIKKKEYSQKQSTIALSEVKNISSQDLTPINNGLIDEQLVQINALENNKNQNGQKSLAKLEILQEENNSKLTQIQENIQELRKAKRNSIDKKDNKIIQELPQIQNSPEKIQIDGLNKISIIKSRSPTLLHNKVSSITHSQATKHNNSNSHDYSTISNQNVQYRIIQEVNPQQLIKSYKRVPIQQPRKQEGQQQMNQNRIDDLLNKYHIKSYLQRKKAQHYKHYSYNKQTLNNSLSPNGKIDRSIQQARLNDDISSISKSLFSKKNGQSSIKLPNLEKQSKNQKFVHEIIQIYKGNNNPQPQRNLGINKKHRKNISFDDKI